MQKKRVFLSKGGLDGHDRGLVIVARALRDAGLEVVYGHINQSPRAIVTQALEEDVDMIGLSIHTGAHLWVFSEVLRLLKEKSGENWFLFGGGVIPQKDIPTLEKMGVKKIFLPGTDTKDIANFVSRAPFKKTETGSLSDLLERVKRGEALAASRLMTLVQKGNRKAKELVSEFPIVPKDTILIGVTGPGGVGKSALINKLVHSFRKEEKTIGVIVCDPVSPISGGSFLGDRIRMQDHTLDEGVFVRSLAQYQSFKGVTPETPYLIKIFGALKKNAILIETVGAGQVDLGFKDLVDTLILVLMPGLGDAIQVLKGGVIETADMIVVNQSDKPGADMMFQNLLTHFGDSKKIYKTNSITGEGIAELVKGIKERKKSS